MKLGAPLVSFGSRAAVPSRWDALAILLVLGLLVFFAEASSGALQPLTTLQSTPVSLDPVQLPFYAARTTLRMLLAMVVSLVFTFTYATLAAKSRRAERILIPLLDILQSVPILGFISVTVVFFMSLVPGRVLGAEFAAVFAIFTSQAWNMAFSFYQSLRTVPVELGEAAACFHLTRWQRFWRLDVPFAMPALIWNMMMSMSGGWFFVVASEAISVGNTTVSLPGVGSYIAVAVQQQNLAAVAWAIAAMLAVILIIDQLLFRPLVVWSDRFRFDQQSEPVAARSWILTILRRSGLVSWTRSQLRLATYKLPRRKTEAKGTAPPNDSPSSPLRDWIWIGVTVLFVVVILGQIGSFVLSTLTLADVLVGLGDGLATLSRVVVLIGLASLLWVPVGIWVGIHPRAVAIVQPVAQIAAAFPANLLFPIAVSGIVAFHLNANVWLSPLMILGTQWYILFNVIAGASALPLELRDVGTNLRVRGLLWWRKIGIPAVLPFYVTGAITASGGSWNASIVSEVASWGDVHLHATGIGAYIADATNAGDFHRVILGVAVMSFLVVLTNRILWRPLYRYAERRFRLS